MYRDDNGISEQAYMYEAILAKHELNEAMFADGAGPHALTGSELRCISLPLRALTGSELRCITLHPQGSDW